MLTEGEKELRENVKTILAKVTEISDLAREIKLWRKFVAWAFGFVTVVLGLADFWSRLKEFFHGS